MSTFTLYEDYTPPSWSMRPKLQFYLEILKSGAIIGEKKIDNVKIVLKQKAMYLIGKNPQSDIILDNPTISRKHAVLQSKNTNEFFVYDLGSTHGTFINNIKIPTKLFHKLKLFDQIRFGQSQRIYVFRCTDLEKEDSNQQELEYQKKQDKKNAKREFKTVKDHYLSLLYQNPQYKHMKPRKKQETEIDGIDWGIDDEQEVYRYQQEQDYPLEPELLLQLPGLQEQVIDKIHKYGEKLSSYRSQLDELDNILAKERKNYGLDETKERNKTDLESKVQELGSELESLEIGLKFVIFGDRIQKINKFEEQHQSSEEEDEFYDNTIKKKNQIDSELQQLNNKQIIVEQTTESYQQLKLKYENLIEQRDELNNQLLQLKNNEEKDLDEEDELDQYMKQTAVSIAQEERPKLLEQLKIVMQSIEQVSNQLKFVKPDIKFQFFQDDEEEEQINKKTTQQNNSKQNIQVDKKQSTLDTLKKLKEQAIKEQQIEDEEEDEEKILEEARRHYEKEAQKDIKKEKERIKQEKEKQKINEILQKYDEEEEQYYLQQQKTIPKQQPHSRHYRESEIENEQFTDATQFHQ